MGVAYGREMPLVVMQRDARVCQRQLSYLLLLLLLGRIAVLASDSGLLHME